MNYKKFIELIKSSLQDQLGTTFLFHEQVITKSNNIHLNTLIITNNQSNIAPCIHMDSFYEAYQKGTISLNGIVEQILEIYQANSISDPFDTSLFVDFNHAKFKLRGRLINTQTNKTFLEDVPHRNILDLSLIYYADFSSELHKDGCFITIKNSHLKLWNVTEEELYTRTMDNMIQQNDSLLMSFGELFQEMLLSTDSESTDNMLPMYLLTNHNKLYGAVQILNEENLRSATNLIGTDFLLLPSSQHEFILLPSEPESDDLNYLADTVKHINATQLLADEFLSNHIYRYSQKENKITIAI